jgi:hypothetical protein
LAVVRRLVSLLRRQRGVEEHEGLVPLPGDRGGKTGRNPEVVAWTDRRLGTGKPDDGVTVMPAML